MTMDTDAMNNNKRATPLELLRFNRLSRTSSVTPNASSSSFTPASQPGYVTPPSQSRDATLPSRYFTSIPPSYGTVLVPNSSPLGPGVTQSPQQGYQVLGGHDVASLPGSIHTNPWGNPNRPFAVDPLSVSSGFVSHSDSLKVSSRRLWGIDEKHVVVAGDEGPPRKRVNYGPLPDSPDVLNSPGSPEIQRFGQRRRPAIDSLSTSSDESMPDVSSVPSVPTKSRIVRGRRPSPSNDSPHPEGDDPMFTRFLLTMPQYSPSRVRVAWQQSNGDVKKASDLLSDNNWDPKPIVITAEATGKVKEIDEASKAERAAFREKGKKSMIYANRSALAVESKSIQPSMTPSTKTVVDMTLSSPTTPVVAPPRRSLPKKMVVDSESELGLTDSETAGNEPRQTSSDEDRALQYFNVARADALQELTGCTPEQANAIIEKRPFSSVDDLNTKLGQGRKKAGPAGISPRMFEDCAAIFEGYGTVDRILEDCECIGVTLRAAIATWTSPGVGEKGKVRDAPDDPASLFSDSVDGTLSLVSLSSAKEQKPKDYLVEQPALLSNDVQLKEYQLLGVNWLHLLYRKNLSCILADEMGLGKTIQVISFFAYLKEHGKKGPHLVVVPSSTLENWCREFTRFAPTISVQTYYAGKEERPVLRQTLLETQRSTSKSGEGWEVLITTYNLAQGDDRDRKFFRKIEWDTCVFDEGHVLKNFQSQRYRALLRYGSRWRLLLTGTPLQNNLQELVSLMNFILPDQFANAMDSLRAIFKVKGDSKVTMLSQERVSRAKKMMAPFVLRRRKDQVLQDLPKKTERIEWCDLTDLQRSIYTDTLQRSRSTILEVTDDPEVDGKPVVNGRSKPQQKLRKAKGKQYLENSSNVLMDLRKAASHPMLFRTRFTDEVLSAITRQLLKEPGFKKRGALFDIVKEDMEVMTDAELQVFCATYKSTCRYLQDEKCYLDSGKVTVLLRLFERYREENRKILVFSQFTQILDILQALLKQRKIKYLLLTGSTAVDVRQSLVDEFTEDASIPVFLLSTRAGGMGINLTAASVVIMFDQDFNPHNDRQAQDRAYRIGQKRNVEVVKLITRGTIEEDMLKLGETKLALDEAVAGDNDDANDQGESVPEREMKMSLVNALRKQFETQQGGPAAGTT